MLTLLSRGKGAPSSPREQPAVECGQRKGLEARPAAGSAPPGQAGACSRTRPSCCPAAPRAHPSPGPSEAAAVPSLRIAPSRTWLPWSVSLAPAVRDALEARDSQRGRRQENKGCSDSGHRQHFCFPCIWERRRHSVLSEDVCHRCRF